MLDFEFERFFWVAKTRLASWAGYQKRGGAYGSIDADGPSDGSVTVTFAPDGRDDSALTPAELASVQWLLDHDEDIARAALNGLLAAYPDLQDLYDYDEDDREALMPDVASVDDFRTLIGLHNVNVHPLVKDGSPYIGYEFGCRWDEEHGLGILMHGTRVVEVGGADTAIFLWIVERDAGVD